MGTGPLRTNQGTGETATAGHPGLLDATLTRWREGPNEVAGHATGVFERIELTAELGH
jgi:hypothetical protein